MSWESIHTFFTSLTLKKLLPTLLILAIGTLAVKLLLKLFDRALSRSKLDRTMFSFLRATMRVLLISIVLLIAAGSLGVDVTSLVALLSVISLAISLAVQNALANLVGSVTLLATHPFHVGDFVRIGTDSGTVEEISMSYTKIMTVDGKRIYIPNSDAASARICNFSAEGKRRVDLTFSAAYENDIETVKDALLTAAQRAELLEGTQAQAFVNAYRDSGVEYQLFFWVKGGDYFSAKCAVNEEVKREFDRRGIVIPYPQLELRQR